ncbi:MAG: alpha/beta hydrolase [Roseobacter sp.]
MMWTTRPRSEGAGALAYFAHGDGPPLVLIHGVGLRAEAWCGVMPELADQHRVLCIDMPGHGASGQEGTRTLDDFVGRVVAFVDALVGPVYLAGHSMGALLSIEVAARLPEKVRAVAALNTVYQRSPDAARAVVARAEALTGAELSDPTPTLARWFGEQPQGAEAACAAACRDWLTTGNKEGYAAAYRVFAQTDGPGDASLQSLSCPALYLTGSDDPNSTPAMSHALAAVTAFGQAVVLKEAAHMLPMTHPQQVATQLTQFFHAPLNA